MRGLQTGIGPSALSNEPRRLGLKLTPPLVDRLRTDAILRSRLAFAHIKEETPGYWQRARPRSCVEVHFGERFEEETAIVARLRTWDTFLGAVAEGRLETVREMADITLLFGARDEHGLTAIGIATVQGNASMLELLLSTRFPVNAEQGWFTWLTALKLARINGNEKLVLLLGQNGAVETPDRFGWPSGFDSQTS